MRTTTPLPFPGVPPPPLVSVYHMFMTTLQYTLIIVRVQYA